MSAWKGERDINARSIGIEIVNPGHEFGYRAFQLPQMDALVALIKDIKTRHDIPPERVLGHSDVAPFRKQDPGELFDWHRLSVEGIAIWPTPKLVNWTDEQFLEALVRDAVLEERPPLRAHHLAHHLVALPGRQRAAEEGLEVAEVELRLLPEEPVHGVHELDDLVERGVAPVLRQVPERAERLEVRAHCLAGLDHQPLVLRALAGAPDPHLRGDEERGGIVRRDVVAHDARGDP